jgi:transaldolase
MASSSEAIGQTTTPGKRPHSKILVDGGDPQETTRIQQLIGLVDGQTTNPSLIAKNPEIMHLIEAGHRLTEREEAAEYRKIVQAVSPLVGDAGVSIEVFADLNTTADEMLNQGKEMNSWIPNAYIKYPCIAEGLKAAQRSVAEGIRVNMTLCFSQQQAAAVYAATKGSRAPVYVSPFVGRLDDIGQNGVDLIRNIKTHVRSERPSRARISCQYPQPSTAALRVSRPLGACNRSCQDFGAMGKRRNATAGSRLCVQASRRGNFLRGAELGAAVGAVQH